MKVTRTTIQILVVVTALAAASCSRKDASATAPAATSALPQPSQIAPSTDPNLEVLHAWDDAHNRHDVEALRKVYASTVDFYGQKLKLDKVLAAKTRAFQQAADFKQQISDIHFENKDGRAQATFQKAWTSGGKTRQVGAVLELQSIGGAMMIVTETDRSVPSAPPSAAGSPTMSVEEATRLCLPADPAEMDVWACMELADRYEAGNGVPKDISRATELAKKVCDTGITGTRAPFGRVFCYGFSERHGIKPPLGCCGEPPAAD